MGAMGAAAARRPARGTREGHSRGNSVLATMSLWGAHGTTMVIADGYPLADAGFAMVEQEHEEHACEHAYLGESPADPAADYLLSPECLNHIREGGGAAAVAYASIVDRSGETRASASASPPPARGSVLASRKVFGLQLPMVIGSLVDAPNGATVECDSQLRLSQAGAGFAAACTPRLMETSSVGG